MTFTAAQLDQAFENLNDLIYEDEVPADADVWLDENGGMIEPYWPELEWHKKGTVRIGGQTLPWEFTDGMTGGEGSGSNVWIVIKVGDRYFRKEGYYASHYGSDWDGSLYEVKPIEKVVTVYERVKR